jgi:hypothetical protein
MTFERKIIVGLDDIRAVTFERNKCKTRITVPAASLREAPRGCNSCPAVWWSATDVSTNVATSGPAIAGFIQALVTLRVLIRENKENFRLLLEFDEPKGSQ